MDKHLLNFVFVKRIAAALFLSLALCAAQASAQTVLNGRASFDKTVHDFGRISVSDGPVSCTFSVTNVSAADMCIYAVITTCGCTDVKWTRQSIPPGGKGTIDVTFKNDEGPYPFDKTVKVYISDEKKPLTLHLRGEVVKKK